MLYLKNCYKFIIILLCLFIPLYIGGITAEYYNDPLLGAVVGISSFLLGMGLALKLIKKWFEI